MKSVVSVCMLLMMISTHARIDDDLNDVRMDHVHNQKNKKRRIAILWRQLEAQGKKITELVDEYVLLWLKENDQKHDTVNQCGSADVSQYPDSGASNNNDAIKEHSCCSKATGQLNEDAAPASWESRIKKSCCGIACQCCSVLKDVKTSVHYGNKHHCCKQQTPHHAHHKATDCSNCKHDHKHCKHSHQCSGSAAFCTSGNMPLIMRSICAGITGVLVFYLLSSSQTKKHCGKGSCC